MGKKKTPGLVRAPLPLRLRMRALETISPQRAAVVAERLWFTVPSAPSDERRQRFTPADGQPFFLMSGESEIQGIAFGEPDGPLAVLVHGWGGYWQQLSAHVPTLVAAGYHVVAYDAPSHGRSTHGELGFGSGSVLEITQALEAVIRHEGRRPELVVAHSVGAMAVLRAARARQLANAYVFFAPQVRLETTIEWFEQVVGMGPRTRELFVERALERIGLPWEDFDCTQDVRQLVADEKAPRLLVVHDDDDPDVPVAESRRLVEIWQGADFLETGGLGHRTVIWDKDVVAAVADYIATLPVPDTRRERRLRARPTIATVTDLHG